MPSAVARSARSRDAETEALAARLYRDQRRRLLAIARKNSACAEDAEEALQDAFALFIAHFDPSGEAPAIAWLTLTLKRRCWAIYRRRRVQPRARGRLERAVDGRSEELTEALIETGRLGRALRGLPPDQRRAITLVALGYSYREIGELTGWTYTKVNRSLVEGRAALRAD